MTPADLIAWRHAHHLSQGQLAALLGVHPITVARWECGMRALRSQTVAQLHALMVSKTASLTVTLGDLDRLRARHHGDCAQARYDLLVAVIADFLVSAGWDFLALAGDDPAAREPITLTLPWRRPQEAP